MKFTRNLKRYMTGDDVREVKDWLFEHGFYETKIKKITNNRYGNDTYKAVKVFQDMYHLVVDGITGKNTIAKMNELMLPKEPYITEYVSATDYPRLSETARAAINEALKRVSKERRDIVLEALKYATDASIAAQFIYPSSLYIRGGNLYNTDGKLNAITESYLTGAYKKKYASYCTSGRLEMMISAVNYFLGIGEKITGADCSGGIIGILRHFGYISMTTDTTANGLCGSGYSTVIKKEDLSAGDFIGRNGHICLYAGGGYMVEWAGGAYGCQLTHMDNHRCWSFTKNKYVKQTACTKYRRPKMY
ncbi:MAG: peptidoglycan-binding protein [Christensenellaceae bacterium]|nr:peptidoglycan-binding protein [Christensenellaceae bacterium]